MGLQQPVVQIFSFAFSKGKAGRQSSAVLCWAAGCYLRTQPGGVHFAQTGLRHGAIHGAEGEKEQEAENIKIEGFSSTFGGKKK